MKNKKCCKQNFCFKARKIPPSNLILLIVIFITSNMFLYHCQPKVETSIYAVHSKHSSPEGTVVSLWKNGEQKYSETVTDSTYEITFISDADPYFDSITGTKTDYIPYNSGLIYIKEDHILDINLEPFTKDKQFWFYGDSSSPAGTNIKIYNDNRLLEENLSINNSGTYKSKVLYIPKDENIDSINFSKEGYIDTNIYNIKVHPDSNLINVHLHAITKYSYYLTGAESSPENTSVSIYKDAAKIASANVKNYTYISNYWYNEKNTMTLDSIVYVHEGYDKLKFENIEVSEGQNYLDVNLQKTEPYSFYLYGDDCAPEGTYIEVWDQGQYLAYAYVKDGSYQTETWSNQDSIMTLDSIRFMHEGYIKQVHTHFTVKQGKNILNVQLNTEKK